MPPTRVVPKPPHHVSGIPPAGQPAAKASLLELPPEIFCDHISPALGPKDLASFACTSHAAHDLVDAAVHSDPARRQQLAAWRQLCRVRRAVMPPEPSISTMPLCPPTWLPDLPDWLPTYNRSGFWPWNPPQRGGRVEGGLMVDVVAVDPSFSVVMAKALAETGVYNQFGRYFAQSKSWLVARGRPPQASFRLPWSTQCDLVTVAMCPAGDRLVALTTGRYDSRGRQRLWMFDLTAGEDPMVAPLPATESVHGDTYSDLTISDGGRALMQAGSSGRWAIYDDIFAAPTSPLRAWLAGREEADCLLRLSGDGRTLARCSPTAGLARMDLGERFPNFELVRPGPEVPGQPPMQAFAISHDAAVAAVLSADGHLSLISTCLAEPGFVAICAWPARSAAAAHPKCTANCDPALRIEGRPSQRYHIALNADATVVALWNANPCLRHSASATDTLWRWTPLGDAARQSWSTWLGRTSVAAARWFVGACCNLWIRRW